MINSREMIKEYKNSIRPMGIVQVRNIRNNRVYLTASANTAGTINSIRFQLKPVDDPAYDYRDDLKALEAVCGWRSSNPLENKDITSRFSLHTEETMHLLFSKERLL